MMNEMLSNSLMFQLSKYTFQSKKLKRGHHKGGHRSTKSGTSLDFSDYRSYQPGDDLRQIDWNVYARTNKHYIKRFLDEQELVVSVYLDCTNSMTIPPQKWKMASGLAASLGYLSLTSDDRVGIFPIGSETHPFSYKKGRAFSNRLVQYVENVKPNNGPETFSESVQQLIQPKSSFSIVISDLLEPVEMVKSAFKKMQAYKQELYVIQILSAEEVSPNYQGDLELVDSETNDITNVSMNSTVKRHYQQSIQKHKEEILKFCHERGINFITCQANHSIEEIIFNRLTSIGWIH
ncbi:DUF58 domain-containing protein [Ornithinibacillus salinisoli]|uniref:DUF58 domain-containing protein n=1 Tax=Ornithinibacillus salinisoli TaxID=1848459 RepID=A0ABW4W3F2_9BACI